MRMNWQILAILVPILGMMTYFYNRIEKKADERQASNEKKFEALFSKIDQINQHLSIIKRRFDERGNGNH